MSMRAATWSFALRCLREVGAIEAQRLLARAFRFVASALCFVACGWRIRVGPRSARIPDTAQRIDVADRFRRVDR